MASKRNILIAGAGPVGLSAALELARRGFAPRIVDKGAGFTPVAESRALAVNNRTLQLMGPSGVADALLGTGVKIGKMRVVNERGRAVLRITFSERDGPYPFILSVPQGRTERLIAEALARCGVDVEWNTELVALNDDPERPHIALRRGGEAETLAPDILIGADGAGSAVRKAFGFSFDGEGYPVEFGLVDIERADAFDENEAVIRFLKNGAVGMIPLGGGVVRYVSPRPDISEALPDDLPIKSVLWNSSFHVSFRHVQKMNRGVVFLAGDAAHIHSPAGGRGMNLGIEDASWLAWLIAEGRAHEYSDLRLPNVKMVVAQTKPQTDALVHMNAAARFFRDYLAGPLLSFAPFRKIALKRLMGLDTTPPPWL